MTHWIGRAAGAAEVAAARAPWVFPSVRKQRTRTQPDFQKTRQVMGLGVDMSPRQAGSGLLCEVEISKRTMELSPSVPHVTSTEERRVA